MPDELELLEIELKDYEEWMLNRVEKGFMTNTEYRHRKYVLLDLMIMIEKVRGQIKDFEDTVSGTGG